jgi:ACS family glucarate transporter-like MFS transporter
LNPIGYPSRVRHVIVALTTVIAVLLYLDRFCLSIAERLIKEDLHLTDDQSGWMLSAFFWAYALAQVPSGWLSDRYGARLVLALYILLWSLFTGLMGAATSFGIVLALRFGCGLAQAGAFPTSAGIISKWVSFANRGLASSIVSIGGRLGGAIAPVLTAYLMTAFALPYASFLWTGSGGGTSDQGWRPVMFLYGAAGVVVAVAFWLFCRDRPQHHPGCNELEIALIEAGRPAGALSPHGRVGGPPWRSLLSSRGLWLSSTAQFWTNFGWVFLLTWLPRYLAEVHDVPVVKRGWLATLPLIVGMVGMFFGGWLTDRLTQSIGLRWGRVLPMGLSRFVAMGAYLACLGLKSPWSVTLAFAMVAFATDFGTPAAWAYLQDAGGRHVGSILGWGNMWGNIGAALSPLVLNRAIELFGWSSVFLVCAGAFFLAGIAAMSIDATIPIAPTEEAQNPGKPGPSGPGGT